MNQRQEEHIRLGQLEDSVLRLEASLAELRSEVEALGDAFVMTAASLDAQSRGTFLDTLSRAAEAQRELDNERTARAIETLVVSAREAT
ncbi:hypothetical protein [Roseitranquillus sediminis]|uniref:hypothetical protein n=1 Tax=Roseitranquillus sediminis TaxID=2809051 RepID=UPI001D0CA83E|nr:hypothetical protein [Roseitranquillus sediminis]MBM9593406.1 hypothetical protein [Roseitranquillus sediminis]